MNSSSSALPDSSRISSASLISPASLISSASQTSILSDSIPIATPNSNSATQPPVGDNRVSPYASKALVKASPERTPGTTGSFNLDSIKHTKSSPSAAEHLDLTGTKRTGPPTSVSKTFDLSAQTGTKCTNTSLPSPDPSKRFPELDTSLPTRPTGFTHPVTPEYDPSTQRLNELSHSIEQLSTIVSNLAQQIAQVTLPNTPRKDCRLADPLPSSSSSTEDFEPTLNQEIVARNSVTPSSKTTFPIPDKFDGNPKNLRRFATQIREYIRCTDYKQAPHRTRSGFIGSLLTGTAQIWFQNLADSDNPILYDSDSFLSLLVRSFEDRNFTLRQNNLLPTVTQGKRSVRSYAVDFQNIAQHTSFDQCYFTHQFYRGLNPEIRTLLQNFPDSDSLDNLIKNATTAETRLTRWTLVENTEKPKNPNPFGTPRNLRPENPRPDKRPSKMNEEIPRTLSQNERPKPIPLTREQKIERQKERREKNLCLYCGDPNHSIQTCPKRPPDQQQLKSLTSEPSTSLPQYFVRVQLANGKRHLETHALLDSGASANYIDPSLVLEHNLPSSTLPKPIPIILGNGQKIEITKETFPINMSIGPHIELISFLILPSSPNPIILGTSWLSLHNPHVDWTRGAAKFSSPHCRRNCSIHNENFRIRLLQKPENLHTDFPLTRSLNFVSLDPKPLNTPPQLTIDFKHVFDKASKENFPPHSDFDCTIMLTTAELPLPKPIYNLSPAETIALREYLDESLRLGYIRPSKSPIVSPIFFVKKKDGTLRPCIDFRDLNSRTVRDRYPLPLYQQMFDKLAGASFFSKIDLRSAFYQIRMADGHEHFTSFRCSFGQYEYLVMPFGLTNAPSILQRLMDSIFRTHSDFVIVYMDDLLVFSKSQSDHDIHVKTVLETLLAHSLYAKTEKCFWYCRTIEFVGFIVSEKGISPAQDKLALIRDWPNPKNLVELMSFLGFTNYYRDFVKDYSQISIPLTSLTRKNATFEWNDATQTAFENLKQALLNAPTRSHPDFNRPFVLETDASDFALGCVLKQENNEGKLLPIALHSRKFQPAEINYSVYDKELLAIVEAFRESP